VPVVLIFVLFACGDIDPSPGKRARAEAPAQLSPVPKGVSPRRMVVDGTQRVLTLPARGAPVERPAAPLTQMLDAPRRTDAVAEIDARRAWAEACSPLEAWSHDGRVLVRPPLREGRPPGPPPPPLAPLRTGYCRPVHLQRGPRRPRPDGGTEYDTVPVCIGIPNEGYLSVGLGPAGRLIDGEAPDQPLRDELDRRLRPRQNKDVLIRPLPAGLSWAQVTSLLDDAMVAGANRVFLPACGDGAPSSP